MFFEAKHLQGMRDDLGIKDPDEAKDLAIILRIDEEVNIEESELDEFCEDMLAKYEGYLIPSMYKGVIHDSRNG